MRFLLGFFALIAFPVWADGERAGDFDYYVLALSWSPNFCAQLLETDHPQCAAGKSFGFVLHGLWPQYEQGWPSNCKTSHGPPSRRDTASEAIIYGSSGSAWHQWRKHGTCSGLSASEYYQAARDAFASINRPAILREIDKAYRLPASVVEDAFLDANPNLGTNQVTITCKGQMIQEVRICMTKGFEPRQCGSDVIHDCTLTDAVFLPIPSN
ncbi:MAG: ribonuclease T2 [Pseudomonadota bacterium]